jgi:hypothetical protein
MKIDYKAFDELIIQSIVSGCNTYNGLCAKLDEPAKMYLVNPNKPTHRVIDRRLQAIKQRGLISYLRNEGWKINVLKEQGLT